MPVHTSSEHIASETLVARHVVQTKYVLMRVTIHSVTSHAIQSVGQHGTQGFSQVVACSHHMQISEVAESSVIHSAEDNHCICKHLHSLICFTTQLLISCRFRHFHTIGLYLCLPVRTIPGGEAFCSRRFFHRLLFVSSPVLATSSGPCSRNPTSVRKEDCCRDAGTSDHFERTTRLRLTSSNKMNGAVEGDTVPIALFLENIFHATNTTCKTTPTIYPLMTDC